MSKELKLAAAQFPAFAWNGGIAEDLRGDLLELQLNRELSALGGKIVERDGQLKLVRADADYMDLFDANHQKVDLDALYNRVKSGASFKALTYEGAPKPAQQPGETPEPKTTNEAMRKAYRQGQESLEAFQRNQQETQAFEQRTAESFKQQPTLPADPYQAVNRSRDAMKRAAEESLAAFQKGQ